MSGIITIQGSSHSGIVPVPSDLPSNVNALLSAYLGSVSGAVIAGTASLETVSVPSGQVSVANASLPGIEQFVSGSDGHGHGHGWGLWGHDDSHDGFGGGFGWGQPQAVYSVSGAASTVLVQAQGDMTLGGNGNTSVAVFGASSNVTYTDGNGGSAGGADSIFAAGGANDINLYATTNTGSAYDVYSAGKDMVNQYGGAVTISALAGARDTAIDFGGRLDFINASGDAATVFGGYGAAVTAFGGAGGGLFAGGTAGGNLLEGGAGSVTLITGGANDTLIGGAGSKDDSFIIGSGFSSASGVASTAGTGLQSFIIGNAQNETLTGSTVTGASNQYDIAKSWIPSTLTVTDFASSNSAIYLTGNAPWDHLSISNTTLPGGATGAEIQLSDNTKIYLAGVSANSLVATTAHDGTIKIT